MSQHLMLQAPGERYGPLPNGEGNQPVGFGRYAHMGSPADLLGQLAGLGMFPEGTVINEGLTKSDGMMPALGQDYRPWFLKWLRNRVWGQSLKRKAVIDSSSALIHTTTDQEIIDTTRRETPLMELIPMETARGKTTSYDVLTARGNASVRNEAFPRAVSTS